jgi:hypothetical protein
VKVRRRSFGGGGWLAVVACVAGWLVLVARSLVGWLVAVCAGVRLRVCLRDCVRVFVSWFVRACVLSWVEILCVMFSYVT